MFFDACLDHLIFICHWILFILPCAFGSDLLMSWGCWNIFFLIFQVLFLFLDQSPLSIGVLMPFWLWGIGQCTCATHEGSNLFISFHPHFWLRSLSSSMNHSRPLSLFSFTNFDLVDACDHGLDSSYYAQSFCAIGPSLWTFHGSDLLWFHFLSCNAPLILEWHFIAYSTWWQ